MSKIIKVRHSLSGDTRRIGFSEWPDLLGLDQTLRSYFGAELPTPYSLRYTDADGDQISITSNAELREATATARNSILNLTVSPATSAASSISLPSSSSKPSIPSSSIPAPYAYPVYSSPSTPTSTSSIPRSSPATPSSTQFSFLPEMSVTTSQAHDTLFIDDVAPQSFVQDFQTLLQMGYDWELARDTLIDYGGNLSQAANALHMGSPSRPRSLPTSRHYFSVAFARNARSLTNSGYPLAMVVAALIRNAGVAANAATELASATSNERCPKGHLLEVSSYNIGEYANTWFCDRCKRKDKPGQRWFCIQCKYDVCFNCKPAPTAIVSPSIIKESPAPIISDMSLPPSLLEPVRMLEAMGFKDRAKVLECLVNNAGDIVKCAQALSQERRAVEEREAKEKRQAERLLQQQRAKEEAAQRAAAERARLKEEAAQKREAARLRAEQERQAAEARRQEQIRQRELQTKRQDAAKIAVQTPEKLGSDLKYLQEMGFDTVSSTMSLFNAGGDVNAALEELLRLRDQ